jgi:hypothetical protein
MLAPATAETVLALATDAGRLADAARARLGISAESGPEPSTAEAADALAAFHFPDDAWTRVLYDLVIAARDEPERLEAFVAALVPIYFGRVGSFVIENRRVTTAEAEERVERQARQFELLKPYLVARWDGEPAGRAPGTAAGARDAALAKP